MLIFHINIFTSTLRDQSKVQSRVRHVSTLAAQDEQGFLQGAATWSFRFDLHVLYERTRRLPSCILRLPTPLSPHEDNDNSYSVLYLIIRKTTGLTCYTLRSSMA